MEKRLTRKTASRRKALSEEIIGADFSREVPPRWRKYYERLIAARDALRGEKGNQLRAAKSQNLRFSQHMADAGTNSYEKDLAFSRASSEQEALFEIDAALDRIQEGTFGICELTGKTIERERLDAIPWTRFCSEAERGLEAKGAIPHAHLSRPERLGRSSTGNNIGEEWDREGRVEPVALKSSNSKSRPTRVSRKKSNAATRRRRK
jgi:RNA polymerase-binding transcription factor DksA